jgi:hypothetical protein
MSKSLIQTINPSSQAVAVDGIIPLGSVLRRFGCNLRLSGNAIEVEGEGYYTIDCDVTAVPTAAGDVTIALYADGVPIAGATATGTGTAGAPITLPISTTIRRICCGATSITCVLTAGAGNVTNINMRVVKE